MKICFCGHQHILLVVAGRGCLIAMAIRPVLGLSTRNPGATGSPWWSDFSMQKALIVWAPQPNHGGTKNANGAFYLSKVFRSLQTALRCDRSTWLFRHEIFEKQLKIPSVYKPFSWHAFERFQILRLISRIHRTFSTRGCFRFCENVIRILIRNSYTLVPFPTNRYWAIDIMSIGSQSYLGFSLYLAHFLVRLVRWPGDSLEVKRKEAHEIFDTSKWAPKLVTKCFWSSNIFQMPKTAHIPRFYSRWKYVCVRK